MKTKLKIMMALLVAICITGISTVNAATEFSDKDKNMIVTLEEDLGVEGTVETEFREYKEAILSNLYLHVNINNVDQTFLNEYASKERNYKAEIKFKVPSDLSIEDIDKTTLRIYDYDLGEYVETDVDFQIKEIDGQKYFVYCDVFEYDNMSYVAPVNNNDVRIMLIERVPDIIVTKKDGSELFYMVYFGIGIYSEHQAPDFNWYISNNYFGVLKGKSYTGYRPLLGDKIYQEFTKPISDFRCNYDMEIPTTANLEEYFYTFAVSVYQGESIEVENLGTLKYAGIEDGNYVYKNSLDNLKADDGKEAIVKIKGRSGYEYTIRVSTWCLSECEYEYDEYTQTTDTAEINNNITVSVSGKGKFEVGVDEITVTDTLYKRLLDGLANAIDTSKNDSSNVIAFDLHIESLRPRYYHERDGFEGSLELTFNVGAEHNGKKYVIGHLKHGLEYEYFEGTVKDGKITITVDSLSPFMVSFISEKASVNPIKPTEPVEPTEPTKPENNKPNKGELDDTPKTGSETEVLNAVSLSSITTMITLAGVVVCKKRK